MSAQDLRRTATRCALSIAAIELLEAAESVHDVTVDAIAEHAGYARRTFFNHFPTKESAVRWPLETLSDDLLQAAFAVPPGESLWTAFQRTGREALDGLGDELPLIGRVLTLFGRHPALGVQHQEDAERTRTAVGWVADRLGLDPVMDPFPRLFVAAAAMTLETTNTQWHLAGGDIGDWFERTCDSVRNGLPSPVPESSGVSTQQTEPGT